MKIKTLSKLTIIIGSSVLLQGCIAALIGGGAVATDVATDPRTIGSQIDDEKLELAVKSAVNKDAEINESGRVVAVSYSGKVLLLGQVPSESAKQTATSLAKGVENVKEVYNEMSIGQPLTVVQKSQDSWITAQVKSKILLNSSVKTSNVKVVTENAVVYLMGNLTADQANAAAEDASRISGVTKVVKVVTYLN